MKIRSDKRRSGATAVEVAVCFPVFIMIVVGIIEFSRVVMVQQIMQYASFRGARMAAVSSGSVDDADGLATNDDIETTVKATLGPVYTSILQGVETGTEPEKGVILESVEGDDFATAVTDTDPVAALDALTWFDKNGSGGDFWWDAGWNWVVRCRIRGIYPAVWPKLTFLDNRFQLETQTVMFCEAN